MIYITLFLSFFKIGIFSFGGGLAMLPLIFQTVQKFGFMSASDFSNLVALSQVTPGPVAVNAATFIGYNFGGLAGAACATLGVALPSFLLIITVIHFLDKFRGNDRIEAAFTGIRPATVGLIAAAAVFVGESALIDGAGRGALSSSLAQPGAEIWESIRGAAIGIAGAVEMIPCIVFIATVLLAAKFKVGPVKIIIIMAAVGVIFCS